MTYPILFIDVSVVMPLVRRLASRFTQEADVDALVYAWFRRHLHDYQALVFANQEGQALSERLEPAFCAGDDFAMSRFFELSQLVAHPTRNPFFYDPCRLEMTPTSLVLDYRSRGTLLRYEHSRRGIHPHHPLDLPERHVSDGADWRLPKDLSQRLARRCLPNDGFEAVSVARTSDCTGHD